MKHPWFRCVAHQAWTSNSCLALVIVFDLAYRAAHRKTCMQTPTYTSTNCIAL